MLYHLSYGRMFVFLPLTPYTFNLYLVAERINRFAVDIHQLHDFVSRAPHRRGSADIYAPRIALEIDIGSMRIDTAVVVEIFYEETLACSRDSYGRRERHLAS